MSVRYEATPRKLFIGGIWRDAASGRTFDVEDPATGRALVEVPDGEADDALDALTAADETQEGGRRPLPASAARSCDGPTRP